MASLEFMVGGLVAWCWLNALAMSPPALSDTVVTAPERLVAMICGIDTHATGLPGTTRWRGARRAWLRVPQAFTPSLQNTVMRDRTA